VLDELSNVEVLQSYGLEYPPEGPGWRSIRCPFHEDTRASASSNGSGFVCFGCGVRGGPIQIIMEREGIDYHSATIRYQEITGKEHPALSRKALAKRVRVNLSEDARDYERDNQFFSSRSGGRSSPRIRPRLYDG
jgi:hypothetical protein